MTLAEKIAQRARELQSTQTTDQPQVTVVDGKSIQAKSGSGLL